MKHSIYLSLFFLFALIPSNGYAQSLFIDAENITLTEGSQLFVQGTLQAENDASIISENETALTTLQLGNQLIGQIIPFATLEGEQIPLLIQTEEVSDNSSITASTYPTLEDNTPFPSNVTDLLFNEANISVETLNRFWILTLNEITATITFTFANDDITGNEANEEKLQLIFHNGTQWVHIDSGSSDGAGSNSYTATISQSGVYALFAGDVSLCAAGDIDQDGICDDVDDCIGEAILFALEETICEGEEFEGFTESGTFTDTFTAQNGCDSTRTLELTVLPNILNELEVSICEGEEFEGFSESGTFEDVFTAANGCDSTRLLQLEVLPNTLNELEVSICEGEEFEGFSETGIFENTFTAANGCDSTRILRLEVVAEIINELEVSICEGEEFEGFTEAGTFEDTFVSSGGCDSTRILQLEVLPHVFNELEATICAGEEFEGFTESGTFEDVFSAANGCDSTRILQLTVLPEISTDIGATICAGEDFEGFTESGTFTDTFTAANGCDSTRTLQLEVLPLSFSEVQATICEGESFEGFTEAGVYETVLTAANGCDSLRMVVLQIAPEIELADTTITDDTGDGTGTIEVILNGNVEDFTFEWSNGATGSNIGGLEFGTYTVIITDPFDCTTEFEFEVELNTAIEDHAFLPLQFQPNPTQSAIWVQLPNELQNRSDTSLQLLNLQGQLVKTWKVANAATQELSLLEVNPGMYLLQIQEGETMYFAKIVKM